MSTAIYEKLFRAISLKDLSSYLIAEFLSLHKVNISFRKQWWLKKRVDWQLCIYKDISKNSSTRGNIEIFDIHYI